MILLLWHLVAFCPADPRLPKSSLALRRRSRSSRARCRTRLVIRRSRANTAAVIRRHSVLAASKAARAFGTSCLVADASSPFAVILRPSRFPSAACPTRPRLMAAIASPRNPPVIDCSTRAANTSGKLGQSAIISALVAAAILQHELKIGLIKGALPGLVDYRT